MLPQRHMCINKEFRVTTWNFSLVSYTWAVEIDDPKIAGKNKQRIQMETLTRSLVRLSLP